MTTQDESLQDMLRAFITRFETFTDEQHEFNAEQREFNAEQHEFNAEQREFNAEQREFNAKQQEFNADTDERLRTMGNDLGVVKGGYARTEILRKASVIAQDMGYRFVKNLRRSQILDFADKAMENIDEATLNSFRNADLIMEVKDSKSRQNYIAVEASYTVHIRDVRRAKRNPELLYDLTEVQSHAAVAGVEMNEGAERQARDGNIHWYRIPRRDLQPE